MGQQLENPAWSRFTRLSQVAFPTQTQWNVFGYVRRRKMVGGNSDI